MYPFNYLFFEPSFDTFSYNFQFLIDVHSGPLGKIWNKVTPKSVQKYSTIQSVSGTY